MKIKKNWFTYLFIAVYEIMVIFAMFSTLNFVGKVKILQYIWYAGLLVSAVIVPAVFCLLSFLAAKLKLDKCFQKGKTHSIITEAVIVLAVIAAGTAIRIIAINNIHIVPDSDYGTYFKVASTLVNGTFNESCTDLLGYISCFPHIMGFPFFLSLLFKITGPSLLAGLYFNLVASMISVFLVYRIARLVSGRVGGFIALMLAAFWPSMIVYNTILATEPLFICFILTALYIVTYMFYYPAFEGKVSVNIILCVFAGIALAAAAAVRPVALVMLAAMAFILLASGKKFGRGGIKKFGFIKVAVSKGWCRVVLIAAVYFIGTSITSAAVTNTLKKPIASGKVSFGYNLMVGVNENGHGMWNVEDDTFLNYNYELTNSAAEAHRICLVKAIDRIEKNPERTLNLAISKFSSLWGNDDYGTSWNIYFLKQQNNLPYSLETKLNAVQEKNDLLYFAVLSMCAVAGYFLFKKKQGSSLGIPVLFFIGTALMHMLLETQGRYHYDILPMFMLLTAFAVSEIFKHYKSERDEKQKVCKNKY